MATTIGGGTNEDGSLQNTIVIDDADLGKIDIVTLENADRTELAVSGKIDGLQIGLLGDQDTVIAGRMITNGVFSNEAAKGKTANVVISNTKTKNLEFTTPGKGATDLDVREGKFVKGSISTSASKATDSINFGSTTTVNASSVAMGRGADTLTFQGGFTLKGKTTVESGKGKDVIDVNRQSGKGKLILSDFSKKDTLIVDGDTITNKNLEDAPKWIKFDA